MNYGRVFIWRPDGTHPLGGRLDLEIVPLRDLTMQREVRLHGRLVQVTNGGALIEPGPSEGATLNTAIGDARPDSSGHFIFGACWGGARVDKTVPAPAPENDRLQYVEAAHFGEVNTYYHLHKLASYVEGLLDELRLPRLPQVTAVVNAHHAATEHNGIRDGIASASGSTCFQGGHYRLPGGGNRIPEYHPISADGEIHLGPGRRLLKEGALAEFAARDGRRYRKNASHNLGIIYHEYGHHIARHTADFRANRRRSPNRQDNLKIALDEGTADYWAAVMLQTPHIWACHRERDDARNLSSANTMDDFDTKADPHTNGTIWAAMLWHLRAKLRSRHQDGDRRTDMLVLKALHLMGEEGRRFAAKCSAARGDFAVASIALLRADSAVFGGRFRDDIVACLSARKILPVSEAAKFKECDQLISY